MTPALTAEEIRDNISRAIGAMYGALGSVVALGQPDHQVLVLLARTAGTLYAAAVNNGWYPMDKALCLMDPVVEQIRSIAEASGIELPAAFVALAEMVKLNREGAFLLPFQEDVDALVAALEREAL